MEPMLDRNMEVYVLFLDTGEYSDWCREIYGVYSTLEKAQAAAQEIAEHSAKLATSYPGLEIHLTPWTVYAHDIEEYGRTVWMAGEIYNQPQWKSQTDYNIAVMTVDGPWRTK